MRKKKVEQGNIGHTFIGSEEGRVTSSIIWVKIVPSKVLIVTPKIVPPIFEHQRKGWTK